MKFRLKIVAIAALAVLVASPVAAWKLVKKGEPVIVAKSAMVVTASEDWNRVTRGYVKNTELWTLDGISLNEIYLIGGAATNTTLFYEFDKKNNPLPRFNDTMTLTDLPDLVERTWRVGRRASVFKMGAIEPAKMGGKDAIRFGYDYVTENNHLAYKGQVTATIVDKKLYLIDFEAPAMYYFNRDRPKAEAIVAGVSFRVMPVKK